MDPFPSLLARLRRLVQQLHAYLDLDALQRHTQPDLAWISTADLDALLCTTEVLHAAL